MAKKRRGRNKKPLPPKKRSTPKEEPMDSLPAPNHNVPFSTDAIPKARQPVYPLLRLAKSEPGVGTPTGLLFVDDMYKCIKWPDREIGEGAGDCPPTWMDPEMFVNMCLDNDDINTQLNKMVTSKTKTSKILNEQLTKVFEEVYLVYAIEQFEKAIPLIAAWLVAFVASEAREV